MQIHKLTIEQSFASLNTTATGLATAEAQRRGAEFGANSLEEVDREHVLLRFVREFTHFFAIVLWLGAGLLEPSTVLARSGLMVPEASRFGSPPAVLAPALENFDELHVLLPGAADGPSLNALAAWPQAEFEHIIPFDCIEFNEDFRWIDVASEIAFTYVDLLDHRQPGLAGCLLNEWLSASGDYAAVPVLGFYAVYRAMVRAKVAAIRAAQGRGGAERVRHGPTSAWPGGWSVIVDAAFLKREERAVFRQLAADIGVRYNILAPHAAPDELEVLQRQQCTIEVLDSDEGDCLLRP
jgi:hypothetical protein